MNGYYNINFWISKMILKRTLINVIHEIKKYGLTVLTPCIFNGSLFTQNLIVCSSIQIPKVTL